MNIGTKNKTLEILEKFNISPTKKFGQNFLIDMNILKKIVTSANITKDTLVIEVGPGIGALTEQLAQKAGQVISIEIDAFLIPILNESLKEYDNVKIVNQDVLKTDISDLIKQFPKYSDIAVVANLPYYITTPIIMMFLETNTSINRLILMMQKEVANRLKADVKTKEYNSLSITIQYYMNISKVTDVSHNSFHPKPAIDSTVVKLERLNEPPITTACEKNYFQLIRNSFVQRRKTLINNLLASYKDINRNTFENIFAKLDIPLQIRADNLTMQQYAKLADELLNHI